MCQGVVMQRAVMSERCKPTSLYSLMGIFTVMASEVSTWRRRVPKDNPGNVGGGGIVSGGA
jgi:hypothetical protein